MVSRCPLCVHMVHRGQTGQSGVPREHVRECAGVFHFQRDIMK